MNDPTTTRWWWVRHAVVPNPGQLVYGALDFDCDTSDTVSFEGLARNLPENAVWVVSGLKRAHQTAEAISRAGLKRPEFVVEPAFNEQSFGDWQKRSWEEIRREEGPRYSQIWQRPADFRPPNGESFVDQMGRVTPAIERLTREYAGRDIIAVTHGGTIRVAITHALDLKPQRAMSIFIENLSMTGLYWVADSEGRGSWRVEAINRLPVLR